MAKILMVISQNDFRNEELFETMDALKKAGHESIICSSKKGICKGMLGKDAIAKICLSDVNSNDYDCIVFVGGSGAKQYFIDSIALNLAREFFQLNKLVCAICIAPSILANAGILIGKKAAVYYEKGYDAQKKNIIDKGAIFSDKDVEIDGLIITANGPKSAKKFGQAIANALDKKSN